MILVAGGTGRLGTELVRRLIAQGERVRVLTRDPAQAAHLPGVEVVVGDVRQPADLGAAANGVSAIVSAVHGFVGKGHVTPASVDRDGNANLIDAARTVGAHYILMSVIGASPDHPLELFRMKAAAEQHLQHSDLPWTVVRAGAFLELYQDLTRRTAARSKRPLVFGRGGNPIQFASISEVATVLERALTDPSARGTVIQVDGPFMTFNQLAASLAPELGAAASRPRHFPRAMLRCMAVARSTPPGRQAHSALIMDSYDLETGQVAR
jgi:NADH dehydrogenase